MRFRLFAHVSKLLEAKLNGILSQNICMNQLRPKHQSVKQAKLSNLYVLESLKACNSLFRGNFELAFLPCPPKRLKCLKEPTGKVIAQNLSVVVSPGRGWIPSVTRS